MKKLLIGVYNPTILLTYAGVFSAMFGIALLLRAQFSDFAAPLDVVMILLIISGVCDMFDGTIARCCKRSEQEKQFGIQLDSLADTVSFVAFPAAILLYVTECRYLSILIACFYVFSGIMRLGWFNITTEENKGCYKGLPVTLSALIFPAAYLLMRLIDLTYLPHVFLGLFACVGLLFILNFRIKKPGIKVPMMLAILAVLGIIGLILL